MEQSRQHETTLTEHGKQILELRRLLEDAENRNWHSHLKIRGLPEDIHVPEAKQLLLQLFNCLLGRDDSTEILINHIHSLSHQKGATNEPAVLPP